MKTVLSTLLIVAVVAGSAVAEERRMHATAAEALDYAEANCRASDKPFEECMAWKRGAAVEMLDKGAWLFPREVGQCEGKYSDPIEAHWCVAAGPMTALREESGQ